MSPDAYAVILVNSTSHAVRIEKLLAQRGIACKMIPVPRSISSDCGACVRIRARESEAARQVIKEAAVEIQEIVDV
ncbi:DUF3343 domain-containing protein [Candidatus Fermentibacteria bacterium]|nr:DUF3343 domain-containing protein [Candidatus Fermentibacteria bacterium]